jgi:hypothetical protein
MALLPPLPTAPGLTTAFTESHSSADVMSRDIPDSPNPQLGSAVVVSGWGFGGLAGGLVVAGGVEGEVAERFAGRGVDDPDVEVGDEEDDGGSAQADVV